MENVDRRTLLTTNRTNKTNEGRSSSAFVLFVRFVVLLAFLARVWHDGLTLDRVHRCPSRPLPLPAELGLVGRAFVDVGSLSDIPSGPGIVDSPAARVGVGAGISWRSPFGLINIDVAQAVVKQSYDQTQVFRFGFGTRF